jgi:hypothetical protein
MRLIRASESNNGNALVHTDKCASVQMTSRVGSSRPASPDFTEAASMFVSSVVEDKDKTEFQVNEVPKRRRSDLSSERVRGGQR